MEGRFPILQGQTDEAYNARRNHTPYPVSVAWDLVKDHEQQAALNHSQSLKRLAQRGGLSPAELWCVVHDKDLQAMRNEISEMQAIKWLRSLKAVEWKTT